MPISRPLLNLLDLFLFSSLLGVGSISDDGDEGGNDIAHGLGFGRTGFDGEGGGWEEGIGGDGETVGDL